MTIPSRNIRSNPVEQYSGAWRTIETEHAKIHDGGGFHFSHIFASVANSAYAEMFLANPAGNFPHLRHFNATIDQGAGTVHVYEGATASSPGTPNGISNLNRNSANTPSLVITLAPTITVQGTIIDTRMITGVKKEGGSGDEGYPHEWILKQGTNYVIRVTNNSGATSDINLTGFFYE